MYNIPKIRFYRGKSIILALVNNAITITIPMINTNHTNRKIKQNKINLERYFGDFELTLMTQKHLCKILVLYTLYSSGIGV